MTSVLSLRLENIAAPLAQQLPEENFISSANRIVMEKNLKGKKIAVLVESQYIPGEIAAYQSRFSALGAQVHLMSRLWDQASLTFVSEVEVPNAVPEVLHVNIDFDKVNLDEYSAVLMSANYTSVRLRQFDIPKGKVPTPDMAATAPAVQFFAQAMTKPNIVKGALCHGLWILTPVPHSLRGRKVICHEVLMADVANAGGKYAWDPSGVVADGDLVTGNSWHVVNQYCDRIIDLIV